ncbi:MerR family transcriptional regulator [Nocardia seriolae]|uniref:Mercuric resistance operon regulatory protein n=2 Tax=Nocardia seriolae TaxID=37332 RepID=A0A0B8ND56_9NOCA|nr:MerR family transcriptional regulator [Nocardia seriolae]APA94107.1 Mercuric resistance operon regulatory protein [Nocardia seriolae]APB01876.1 Mercuric resistance operon regulatory protein [Nocardia seriolae]MTJ60670.1 MerR family transcriptional regulator [Nocardia seriolae]MTJ75880.1 MerR family transcriptional regulator [Nocardia seriolae]MTJ91182.1 MerR family transcriptional regulator [Nocardia seriolae]
MSAPPVQRPNAARDAVEFERPRYSIGEVSERCGLTRDTLRWYERIGLMDYVGRDHSGQRRFSDRDLEWLAFIGKLRLTGMSVADMVKYAELVRAGQHTYPERLEMFRRTRAEVLDQIEELRSTLVVLDYKIALYENGPSCEPPTLSSNAARREN